MISRIALVLFTVISLVSCSVGDTVKPRDVQGAWVLQSVSIDIKLLNEEAEQETADFSDVNSIITFNSDGTFTSSIDSGNELVETLLAEDSGTYAIIDKEFIELTTGSGLTEQVTKFGISVSGNEMTFKFTKELYRELIESQADALAAGLPEGVNIQELIDETLAGVEYFNVTYTFIGT